MSNDKINIDAKLRKEHKFIQKSTEYKYTKNPQISDKTTTWGKGEYFLTCDGGRVATMEEVIEYNKWYFENMKNQKGR